MSYFFRVVPDGDDWVCKRGARIVERCETEAMAIMVAETQAALYRPSEVLLHDETGHVEVVARYPAD